MIKNSRFLKAYILIILAGLYTNFHSDIIVPMKKPFSEFPLHHKSWTMISESIFDEDILKVLKTTDYIDRHYKDSQNQSVNLYIGYHTGGQDSGEIHSPKHCLPGSGWNKVMEQSMILKVDGGKLNLVKAIYQKGETKELFLYWYRIKGKTLSNEYSLKIAEITNSILYSQRDAALIRISVPIEESEEASFLTGIQFIRDFYPVIEEFLPA